MIKSDTFKSTETDRIEPHNSEPTKKFGANPIAIFYVFFLFCSLIAWSVWTSLILLKNKDLMYPTAVFAIPFLILLTLPPILSLLIIIFRTFYTLYCCDYFEVLEALDLIENEEQRKLILMPLSVSGVVMTILPAYYFQYKQHYDILISQGVLGFLMVLLFLGVALVPEKERIDNHANALTNHHRLFITIHEK